MYDIIDFSTLSPVAVEINTPTNVICRHSSHTSYQQSPWLTLRGFLMQQSWWYLDEFSLFCTSVNISITLTYSHTCFWESSKVAKPIMGVKSSWLSLESVLWLAVLAFWLTKLATAQDIFFQVRCLSFFLNEDSWEQWSCSRLQARPEAGEHFEDLGFRFLMIWMSVLYHILFHSIPVKLYCLPKKQDIYDYFVLYWD